MMGAISFVLSLYLIVGGVITNEPDTTIAGAALAFLAAEVALNNDRAQMSDERITLEKVREWRRPLRQRQMRNDVRD